MSSVEAAPSAAEYASLKRKYKVGPRGGKAVRLGGFVTVPPTRFLTPRGARSGPPHPWRTLPALQELESETLLLADEYDRAAPTVQRLRSQRDYLMAKVAAVRQGRAAREEARTHVVSVETVTQLCLAQGGLSSAKYLLPTYVSTTARTRPAHGYNQFVLHTFEGNRVR